MPGLPGGPQAILGLQASAGNRAVSRMLARRALRAPGTGDTAQPAIQRSVGFEFETGYKLQKKNKYGNYKRLDKGEVVQDLGDGLKVTADTTSVGDSVVEMVLDPPVDEAEPEKFETALKTFKKAGDEFDAIKEKNPSRHKLSDVTSGPTNVAVTPKETGFKGNPQMTGGIAFDKLFTFLEEATGNATPPKGREGASELTRNQKFPSEAAAITGAGVEVGKVRGSAELKGLVAMLGSYLRFGSASMGPPMNYAKLISFSFMARTDFAAMFSMLPDRERNRYEKHPEKFVTLVLKACEMPGTGAVKVFERGIRKSYDKMSPDFTVDITTDVAGLAVTREDWLMGVTQGQDKISSTGMPALKRYFEGLGALGAKTDRVGDEPQPPDGEDRKGTGIIVELRQMQDAQDYTNFIPIAKQVFKYWAALNKREKKKKKH